MSDSGIIHPLVLNAELGIDILQSDNGPATDHPDAPLASKAYDPATGDWYTKLSPGWVQDGTASTAWSAITGTPTTLAGYGITDAYTKTESDARYLQLSGGSLTGGLTLSADSAEVNTTFAGVTTTRFFTDAGGGAISVDGSNAFRVKTGGKTGTDRFTVDTSGATIGGDLFIDGTLDLYGSGLDGTTYQRFTLYADTTNDLLFEAPLGADNTTKLDYGFGWRGTAPGSGFGMKILGAGGGDLYGRWSVEDSIGAGGQVRAAGWWVSGDTTPLAAELGVDSSIAYLLSYDRGASTYGPLHVNATTISMQAASGGALTGDTVDLTTTTFKYGGYPLLRLTGSGTSAPTGTPADCDVYFQHS